MLFPSSSKDEFVAAYSNKLEVGDGSTDNVDRNGLQRGQWAVGFFGCLGDCIPNGFMAFVCPGVSVAQITARLGLIRYSIVLGAYAALYLLVLLAIVANSAVVNFFCVVAALGAALGVSYLRTTTRALFSIQGSSVVDMASTVVCGPCSIAQMASHVGAYEPGTCSFRPRSTLEGYVRS